MSARNENIKDQNRLKPTGGYGSGHIPNRIEQEEAANYIASMATNLRDVAQSGDLPFLSYLLALVVEEARQTEQNLKDKD